MSKRIVRHLFFLVTGAMLAACGGGGGDSTPNVNSASLASSAGSPAAPSAGSPTAPSAVSPASQPSRSVTLDWNSNTESDLAGYKIYASTSSGAYGAAVATVPANATSFVVPGLQPGVTYFFVITAVDTSGNESVRSAEVSATAPL